MVFESGHLYHIFNRGNNSQKVFFTRDNYLFFHEKVRKYLMPHAYIVAWCLMPNHFHLMVHVNKVEVAIVSGDSEGFTLSETLTTSAKRTLNDSIGIMLRSYSRAIQKQQKTTGSLFQKKTKAICLTLNEGVSPVWFQSQFGAILNTSFPEKEYPQVCFEYIHANPVNDGLVENTTDWEYSSALDYAGFREGKLINRQRANEFGLVFKFSKGLL